ncbi:ABC transporter [Pyrobaculum aerophilum]|uniref:ABC transporter n=1 Tax=Pyrobaculum aerophilum TaxID=13773 RepID=A0A832WFB0_9CREN|nr:ABC transporter [Pyrobaculum aerophilum]HII47741.1 ABC transporter [Pyrobaculum aerophilum]
MRTQIIPVLILAALVAAQQIYVPVLADLSHGEATKRLDFWVNSTVNPLAISDFAKLYILLPPGAQPDAVVSKLNATKMAVVLRGDLSTVDLSQFKVIILGQPPKPLTEAELAALKKWFDSGGKVLWCAADSDYPAQGSEESQVACNDIAEYLGAHIRVDYVSVEDPQHNAGAGYRVVGVIDPPPQLAFLGFMAQRVLFHGPGAIAVVLPNGTWVPATSPAVQKYYNNIFVIARTTPAGTIVESRTSADGKGRDGKAHTAGDKGVFALMALEFMPSGSVLILSGESPYGAYEPMVAPVYYGVALDGPRFFRNLMLWATGNYRELSTMVSQAQVISQIQNGLSSVASDLQAVKSDVAAVKNSLAGIQNDISALKGSVSQLGAVSGQVSGLSGQISALSQKVDQLSQQLNAAVAEANNARTVAFIGTALALIFAIIAAVLAVRRR